MPMKFIVGRQYHVAGWNPGATFELIEVDGETAILKTPVTRRRKMVPVGWLRNTKRYGRAKPNPLEAYRPGKER